MSKEKTKNCEGCGVENKPLTYAAAYDLWVCKKCEQDEEHMTLV